MGNILLHVDLVISFDFPPFTHLTRVISFIPPSSSLKALSQPVLLPTIALPQGLPLLIRVSVSPQNYAVGAFPRVSPGRPCPYPVSSNAVARAF